MSSEAAGPAPDRPAGASPARRGVADTRTGGSTARSGAADAGAQEPAPAASPDSFSLTDPKAMRALAHPVRVALIEALDLADNQTLTATQASELLSESPANCAFHLRTLAKYGLVEETGGGRGRQRPWRLAHRGIDISPPWQDPETRLAADAVASVWIGRWMQRASERLRRVASYPAGWQRAAIAAEIVVHLTAEEAKAVGEHIQQVIEPYRERRDNASLRPAGSLPYEVLLFGYPLTDPPSPAEE
jgi:predicted ArsR family transcriptional regulator